MSEQWERMKELKKPNGKRLVTLQRFPERYVIAPWEEKDFRTEKREINNPFKKDGYIYKFFNPLFTQEDANKLHKNYFNLLWGTEDLLSNSDESIDIKDAESFTLEFPSLNNTDTLDMLTGVLIHLQMHQKKTSIISSKKSRLHYGPSGMNQES